MAFSILPSSFETSRLRLRPVQEADIARLQEIYEASWDTAWAGGREGADPRHIEETIAHKDLPIDANPANHQLFLIGTKAGNRVIGYLDTLGYDKRSGFVIGSMVFERSAQRLGFGTELVEAIKGYIEGYNHIRVSVNLRNWQAIHFWVGLGFNGVLDMKGDKQYAEGAMGSIVLLKPR